jgi:uncharacterized protein (TIGR03086 family)
MLARVLAVTQAVVDDVRPTDLIRPTPCGEYDVLRLLEHVIGWQQVNAACALDADPPFADGSPTYVLTGEPGDELRAAATAWTANLAKRTNATITLPYRGTVSLADVVDEWIAETVIHTWDLAAALHRSVAFEPDVVATAHTGLTKLLAESFAEQGFRPAVAAAPNGLEGLLVRSGRDPGWSVPG